MTTILGSPLNITAHDPVVPSGVTPLNRWTSEFGALTEAINLINAYPAWTIDDTSKLTALTAVTFFDQSMSWNGLLMSRSFTDGAASTFYWQTEEFEECDVPATRACYLAHDAAHAWQYTRDGGPAADLDAEVTRELEAGTLQLRVAQALGAPSNVIPFLQAYYTDPGAIRIRINTGVGGCWRAQT